MHKNIIALIIPALLAGCADTVEVADNSNIGVDSEYCRSTVAEQLSREQTSLRMTSDAQRMAYDQRYRYCMTEKGYNLPSVTP